MKKDPILAVILNIILVGSGHIYLNQVGKGLIIFASAVVIGILTHGIGAILIIIWACFDAHSIALLDEEVKEEKVVGK